MEQKVIFSVSNFIAVVNQTFEYAYHDVVIVGEISNYRVSKNKWVYFDLKDDAASVRCFGVLFQLGGMFEDGMLVRAHVMPKLHPQYGFSVTVSAMQPVGEGSIKRSSDLVRVKLEKEGLFSPDRKRQLPFAPQHIALIASRESAAYGDFLKVLQARWSGVIVDSYDTLVQGDGAVENLLSALSHASQSSAELIVMTRGGGSTDDLQAFSDERLVRAVAASRLPTLVAIGHERDESLAELASDMRASTPSNAAELLFPDKNRELRNIDDYQKHLMRMLQNNVQQKILQLKHLQDSLRDNYKQISTHYAQVLAQRKQVLHLLSPETILQRGYAVIYSEDGGLLRSVQQVKYDQTINVQVHDGTFTAKVTKDKV